MAHSRPTPPPLEQETRSALSTTEAAFHLNRARRGKGDEFGGCDPAPVLELGEHVVDLMTLLIERLVVGNGRLTALGRRDAWCDVPLGA